VRAASAPFGEHAEARLEAFREFVREGLGLEFDESRLCDLERVLLARCAQPGEAGRAIYPPPDCTSSEARLELAAIAPQLTVGETYFFRHAEQLEAFVRCAIPERMHERGNSRILRLLSAGCASGEEIYTLAILLRERVPALEGWRVEIIGVDVNGALIRRARQGRYGEWSLRSTPPPARARWFAQVGREYQIAKELRDAVEFQERNLVVDDAVFWAPGRFDVVLCRNVTMYMAPAAAQGLIARFERSLAAAGFLFLGHAETLRGLTRRFALRHEEGAFYYQRLADGAPERDPRGASAPTGPNSPAAGAERAPVLPCAAASPNEGVEDAPAGWFEEIARASGRVSALADGRAAAENGHPTPGPAGVSTAKVLELLASERFAEALAAVTRAPPRPADDPDGCLLRAVLLLRLGRPIEAEAVALELLGTDALHAEAHHVLGMCHEERGDVDHALECYRLAVHLDATFALPQLRIGCRLRSAGQPEAARRALEQARVLLEREDTGRMLLFADGFNRSALIGLCESELRRCRGER